MPVFHDYQCTSCGHLVEDVMSERKGDIKRRVKCPECSASAEMHFGGFNNQVRWNFSSTARGYNKGFPDPQTGVEYTSYAHKQRVLADNGLVETGASQKFDHIMADAEIAERDQKAAGGRDTVIKADSEDEVMSKIDKAKIDWKETGDLNRDTGGDWSPFDD
jgi:DNA-directed RNA polymerase subunit RPC12/RpoP